MSAAWIRSSPPDWPATAIPMLAETWQGRPEISNGALDRLPDPFAEFGHRVAVQPAAQHDEFVAAEPGGQVARAGGGKQPPGDLDQQRVPRRVPHRVVDRLEPVEVEEQHGGTRPVSRSASASQSSSRLRLGRPVSGS